MAVSVADIDRWRQQPSENEVLEFKEAKQQIDTQDLLDYCVAIGNEGGGHLILGISNARPRRVVGTKAIDNPVGMAEKLFSKLKFRVSIDLVKHPEGRVVVLTIPSRPLGSAFNVDGRYLMRIGQSLQPMSADQLRRILVETPKEWMRRRRWRERPDRKSLTCWTRRFTSDDWEFRIPRVRRRCWRGLCRTGLWTQQVTAYTRFDESPL